MRMLLVGDKNTITGLTTFLSEYGTEITAFSEAIEVASAANRKKFDVAIVDSEIDEAAAICNYFRSFYGIPVVAVISEAEVDWANLQTLKVDGFITFHMGRSELIARLRAVLRRSAAGDWDGGNNTL